MAEGVGFALIIWAIATFDPAMLWPSYLALVPVVGAMLVLAANRQRSWLTANPFARQLGASSYSIYLWHWPLVVLLTYAGEQANPQWMVLAILGSWALGELSLRYVENPSRKGLNHRGL
ncbi:TPA: acyltransferase family protein, partial [Klebsiella pneumoniae]